MKKQKPPEPKADTSKNTDSPPSQEAGTFQNNPPSEFGITLLSDNIPPSKPK